MTNKIRNIILLLCVFNIEIAKSQIDATTSLYTDTTEHRIYNSIELKTNNKNLSKQLYKLSKDSIKLGQLYVFTNRIPNNIRYHDKIKYVEIMSNLTKFGNGFSYLKSIEEIDAISSKINKIPDYFDEFILLKKCFLNSKIKKIPKSFCSLKNLHSLTIYSPRLKTIPTYFENLQNLEFLTLGKVKHSKLKFEELKKLKELDLIYDGKFFLGLTSFNLNTTKKVEFSMFPQSLISLELSLKKIRTIFIGNFFIKSLERLYINNCPVLSSFADFPIDYNDSLIKSFPQKELIVIIENCPNLNNIDALRRLKFTKIDLIGIKPEFFTNILHSLLYFNHLKEVFFSFNSFYKNKIPQEFIDFALRNEFCNIIIEPDIENGVDQEKINKEIAENLLKSISQIKTIAQNKNIRVRSKIGYDDLKE